LKTLLIEIFILKDLAVDGSEQKGGGEGLYKRFELCLYMLRALRMSAPQHGIHGNSESKSSATTPRISILVPVWEATRSSQRQTAMEMQLLRKFGKPHTNYYGGFLSRLKRRIYLPEYTSANIPLPTHSVTTGLRERRS
jgi:hypothetical protein